MSSLPAELIDAFSNQNVESFDQVEKLKSFGIDEWKPSIHVTQFFSSLNLEYTANYAALYRDPHYSLSTELKELFLKQNREFTNELSELIDGKKNNPPEPENQEPHNYALKTTGIVKAKVNSLQKYINSPDPHFPMLNVLLRSCNLETMQAALANITKDNSVVCQIKAQIKEIESKIQPTFASQIQKIGGSPLHNSVPIDISLPSQKEEAVTNSF